ncbi:MAG TPA: hypothetical protein VN039_11945, partial [Nitrospira sp.]|nr:hypothetical protein [Nitrospira sp.]
MQRLPEIKATYDWFFAHYRAETAERAKINDIAGIDQMDVKRDILERGIFVLMFGQFEKAVTSAFQDALNTRATSVDWTRRRGWDASSLKGKKVPFETKLAMVLDSHSPSFAQIIQTYGTRNHCAHGGTTNA